MRNKQTKIVATISDRNCDVELLQTLYDSGMDVVRLNTAHQSPDDTMKIIGNTRKVSPNIALLLDTKGPEVRTAKSETDIEVEDGEELLVKFGLEPSTKETIYVSYDKFADEVLPGQPILIDDGAVTLEAIGKEGDSLKVKVVHGGEISSKKSVNAPDSALKLASITEKDKKYIQFAIDNDLDFIAHSFVRHKEDVKAVKDLLGDSKIKIIAKIENREGIDNIDEIIEAADGIMVARGDLGIEVAAEEVPIMQKEMIRKCIAAAKPVITATQMLESMMSNPRPTRAEVSDVANAILDGTDAIMLSGETAKGKFPVKAVQTMSKIAKNVERQKPNFKQYALDMKREGVRANFVKSAVQLSQNLNADSIVVISSSGKTARALGSFRGKKRIFAQSVNAQTTRQLALTYGVEATTIEHSESTDKLVKTAIDSLVDLKKLNCTDKVIILGGTPDKEDALCNLIEFNEVQTIADNCKL